MRANAFMAETVQWGPLPLRRATLFQAMREHGWSARDADFWAFGRPAWDADPLPDDLARQAFAALESDHPGRAFELLESAGWMTFNATAIN